jgi:hypothetical protein
MSNMTKQTLKSGGPKFPPSLHMPFVYPPKNTNQRETKKPLKPKMGGPSTNPKQIENSSETTQKFDQPRTTNMQEKV